MKKSMLHALKWVGANAKISRYGLWVAFISGVLTLVPHAAQSQGGPTEYQVKAAFLYNFVKFVDWPPGAMGKATRICVIGDGPSVAEIEALAGKPIGDHVIEVKNLDSPANVATCNILFVSASEAANLAAILDMARRGAVLTIGDTNGFAQRGIIINFFLENQKVRFEINVDAAKRAKLTISSQLLRLARIVPG